MSAPRSKIVFAGRHLAFHGGEDCWEYVSRRNARQGVTIVALTAQNRLLLVEQFRVPVGKVVIELPAGLVADDAHAGDKSVTVAARRELREETGYDCKSVIVLCKGSVLPGLSDELNSLCLAEKLHPVEKATQKAVPPNRVVMHTVERGLLQEGERIIVYEVPVTAVFSWLKKQAREGKIVDLKVYAGLFFLRHRQCFDANTGPRGKKKAN